MFDFMHVKSYMAVLVYSDTNELGMLMNCIKDKERDNKRRH